MNKKYAAIALGVAIVAAAILLFKVLTREKENDPVAEPSQKTKVSTTLVTLGTLPYIVEATGTLTAKNKIELYSEVQGTLMRTPTAFKEGNAFTRGQDLLKINSSEYLAQLQSNKSTLVNQIAAMLPDMEVEFPKAAEKWESYLKKFDINGPLLPLPKATADAEKLFVTGKNVYQTFYTVKNQQERISKYNLKAPFSGIVTESNVTEGTLVRSGQKLGEFIDPAVFELQLSIPAAANNYIGQNKKVRTATLNGGQEFEGRISRINAKIDQATQTLGVVVELAHKNLKEGQYLKASVYGDLMEGVVCINGSLLVENDNVYLVRDSTLVLQKIIPLNYVGDSVVVRGLKNNMRLVDQTLVNAYPGMKVDY